MTGGEPLLACLQPLGRWFPSQVLHDFMYRFHKIYGLPPSGPYRSFCNSDGDTSDYNCVDTMIGARPF
ncbi:hypothetical protein AcV5_003043 [Taiwanofungus camphoratus]|nr:hypothetical protein AcV5_003043 [Antrodia cinnamomea]